MSMVTYQCRLCGATFEDYPCHPRVYCTAVCRMKAQQLKGRDTLAERLWSKVDKSGECWEWQGSVSPNGYGHIGFEKKNLSVHRLVYRLTYGEIPKGMLVCHRCDNRRCVRPDHLFLGTQSDNIRDMYAKGRGIKPSAFLPETRARGLRNGAHTKPDRVCRGERHGNAKLTEDAVRDIRARYAAGELLTPLAREYGVTRQLIQWVVLRKGWRHIP